MTHPPLGMDSSASASSSPAMHSHHLGHVTPLGSMGGVTPTASTPHSTGGASYAGDDSAGAPKLKREKFKTKICDYWLNSGGKHCKHGTNCHFAHGEQELLVREAASSALYAIH